MEFIKEDEKSYAVALLDIRMPKMNSIELCKEIRKVNDKLKACFDTRMEVSSGICAGGCTKGTFGNAL
jgi:CheY-like chemotaxis protein